MDSQTVETAREEEEEARMDVYWGGGGGVCVCIGGRQGWERRPAAGGWGRMSYGRACVCVRRGAAFPADMGKWSMHAVRATPAALWTLSDHPPPSLPTSRPSLRTQWPGAPIVHACVF